MGTNLTGCTEWERDFDPITEQPKEDSKMNKMRRVILESPFAGDVKKNLTYGRACVRDSLARGEAPIASHLLYTQPGILRDENPEERAWGIEAGLAWGEVASATVIYIDHGITKGMHYGIKAAHENNRPVEYRKLFTKEDVEYV